MKNIKSNTLTILLLSIIVFMGCEGTTESDPITGTISGTITFSSALPTSAEIIVGLFKDWPPLDPTVPPMSDYNYITNDSLNPNYEYKYSFEDVSFDTYDLIGVSYTDTMNIDVTTNKIFLGAHHGNWPMYFDADTIIISAINYDVTLDFTANTMYAYPCVSLFPEDNCEAIEDCSWAGGDHGPCMPSTTPGSGRNK